MKKTGIILAVILLMATTLAFAGHGRGFAPRAHHGDCDGMGMMDGDRHPGLGMLLRLSDELELTKEQIDQVEQKMYNFRQEMIDKRAQLQKMKLEMRRMQQNDTDESAILNQIDKIGQIKIDLAKMRYQHHNDMKSVLNAAQIDKLEELKKEQLRSHMGRHRGDGPGRQGGRGDGPGPGYGWNQNCPLGD